MDLNESTILSSNGLTLYSLSYSGEERVGCWVMSLRCKYDMSNSNLRPDIIDLNVSL